MTRNAILLEHLNKGGPGLEIGPSHRPAAAKRDGFNVEIVDHLSREGLLSKYKDRNLNLDLVEEVDHIWTGQSYTELTGKEKHYDWIIASHVIEHTPDLIGFLKECDSVLNNDGVVSLAIPDKRYCFDYHRPISALSRVIDSHFSENSIHSAGTVAEYYLNVVRKKGSGSWCEQTEGDIEFIHTLKHAVQGMNKVNNHGLYIDVHAWCFVPHSFRLLINDLCDLGLIPFREVSFTPTSGSEFFVTLGRNGSNFDLSRVEAAKQIEQEQFQPIQKRTNQPDQQPDPSAVQADNVVRKFPFFRGNQTDKTPGKLRTVK